MDHGLLFFGGRQKGRLPSRVDKHPSRVVTAELTTLSLKLRKHVGCWVAGAECTLGKFKKGHVIVLLRFQHACTRIRGFNKHPTSKYQLIFLNPPKNMPKNTICEEV